MKRIIFIILIVTSTLLFNSIPALADDLPCFSSGQSPNSALTNVAISTPAVTSITVAWKAQSGDYGEITYRDINHLILAPSTITMQNTTGSATVTPPAGVASNTLILVTGPSYGKRYIWYDSITYSDGTVVKYTPPYEISNP